MPIIDGIAKSICLPSETAELLTSHVYGLAIPPASYRLPGHTFRVKAGRRSVPVRLPTAPAWARCGGFLWRASRRASFYPAQAGSCKE